MRSVKGVLIDLGGVVYLGQNAIPGSVEAIGGLRGHGVPLRFLTNTTSRPVSAILARLHGLGVPASRDEILTPALAARSYIGDHKLDPHYLTPPALKEDFAGTPKGAKPAVVIGDVRDGFNYRTLNAVFRRLRAGAEFIALASNRTFVDDDGELSLDMGAFVAALEYASGRQAIVLGKPSPAFFRFAAADLGLEPADVAMVGDDPEFDVAAAIKAGLSGILVKTGKWRPGETALPDPPPTAIFDDLASVAHAIIGQG